MISFIMGLLLFGGFYDFSVSATAVCVVAEILFHYCKKKPVYQKKKNYILWIPAVLVGWSVLVSGWALDVSENILGILRGAVVLLWMYRCFLMDEGEKQKIFDMIPYLGAGMTLIGLVSLTYDGFADYFWQARRFGGFFQYSNTCALFLVLGIVLLTQRFLQKQSRNKMKIEALSVTWILQKDNLLTAAVLFLLSFGLFLTGSRSILLLFLVWGIYQAVRVRWLRMPFAAVGVLSFLIAYFYGMLTDDSQNIARIFTLFSSNSTILGRILYDIDALSIAKGHPFGLGYMGYYYIQSAIQTGVYTTRFIHNDLLQILVDYGIPAFGLILVYLGWQLIKGKQSIQKKELLILILVASLVDFHLQYMSILMVAVLCFDLGEKDRVKKQKELRENYIFSGVAIVVFIYFTVAFGAHYLGNNELAIKLFPNYTEAQVQILNGCTDKEKAVVLADEILSHNAYVSEAYHVKVYAAVMDGDFEEALEYMDKSLALRRYDVETFRAYDELLNEMIIAGDGMGQSEQTELLKEFKNELPIRLAELEKETHPIAFRLRDIPMFKW